MEHAREDARLLATERGGVIQGYDPIHSELQLYLIQLIVIVLLCFVLGQLVKRLKQPRVIAEVMAGVLLGPSALGAIPGFTDTMFPDDSLGALTLTAHLGLVLFLFIVGLELDPGLLKSNAKKAAILSIAGQAITWVLSLGVSTLMITFLDDVESGTSFVLFIGVSLSVTAFPVLSRILGENSLMNTSVGALVISAASVDEACVWCLLALVVSTVNAGSPLDAFYVFLLLALFVVVMMTVMRWALLKVVRHIGGDETGPPARGVVITCMMLTLVSAWVTDFIGIDAIFGAFVAGIIVPREHSLHVRIVELVQDVVSVLLLPLYFAVSGLKTDLTLLNNATSWGICAITIGAACLGKIGGGASVARIFGMTGRECLAVGFLMNTRGLVELIILNIGLDAGVLTEEVMAIMVVMALVTTFLTAPLTTVIYPLKYHTLPGLSKRRRRSSDESAGDLARPLPAIPNLGEFAQERLKLLVLVNNPAALDAVARIARLFSGNRPVKKTGAMLRKLSGISETGQLEIHALRLVENTDRFSSDMRALERGESLTKDSLAGILQGFLGLLMIKVRTHISVGTNTDFSQDVTRLTHEHSISTAIIPWDSSSTQLSSQLARVQKLMDSAPCQFVLALNCQTAALATAASAGVSVLVPFFGGDDDIAALLLALAIVERDTSAELVILTFLEPEKPTTGSRRVERVDEEAGDAARGDEQKAPLGSFFHAPTPLGSGQEAAKGSADIETGGAGPSGSSTQDTTCPPRADSATTFNRSSEGPVQANGSNGGASAAIPTQQPGSWLRRASTTSPWDPRELLAKAEALDRVKVTPAWSLNAALGAITLSSASAADGRSIAARIVHEVASAQSAGLVLCGCAGSGQQAVTASGDGSSIQAPLAGANSVHGKWPSLGKAKPAALSLMTKSWHGKSRLHGRSQHGRLAVDCEAGAGSSGRPFGGREGHIAGTTRGGGLASVVSGVINDALQVLVGDVAGGLMGSERAPAVLAVRAGKPSRSPRA